MARITIILVLLGVLGVCVALNKARLTNYCSFPPCRKDRSIQYTLAEKKSCPDESECDDYDGCKYQGDFSFCGENNSHDYIIKTNIVSFFSTHGDMAKYKGKMIRIVQGNKNIVAKVCDTCSDKDCNGCCTKNAGKSGYLIDMESNTYGRFGGSDGDVTWSVVN